jgi:Zn-dependent protease with chaperone function
MFALIDFVCSLPFGIYNHFRDRAFGLTGESLGQWVIGDAKTLPAGILFIAVLMMAFYGVVRFSSRRWWLYIAVVVFAIEVTSDWRDFLTAPKSKHLVPVQDQALAADLQSLAARAGVPSPDLLQTMKGSELKTGASVASWNARPRVVIADPAVSKLSREQVVYTVARQLGEFRLQQHLKYSLIVALLSIVSFYLLYRSGTALIDRYRERFGFERLSDVASWPLFPALFNVFFLLVQPIDAASSRHFRHEADRFGLELVQDNRACAESFIALDSGKLLNPSPGPIHKLWRSFDPPLAERVEFCNTYRPWEQGGPLRYGAMFAEARHSQKTEP